MSCSSIHYSAQEEPTLMTIMYHRRTQGGDTHTHTFTPTHRVVDRVGCKDMKQGLLPAEKIKKEESTLFQTFYKLESNYFRPLPFQTLNNHTRGYEQVLISMASQSVETHSPTIVSTFTQWDYAQWPPVHILCTLNKCWLSQHCSFPPIGLPTLTV